MNVLRAMTPAMAAEFREDRDVTRGRAGETLVLPWAICRSMSNDPQCVCARAFIGSESGEPSTLAIVSREVEADIYTSFLDSPLAARWWQDQREVFAAGYLNQFLVSCQCIEPGQVVRVQLVNSRQMQIYPFHLTPREFNENQPAERPSSKEYGND